MKSQTAAVLRCPQSNQPLVLKSTESRGDDIISGALQSSSGRAYAITNGVPNLMHPEILTDSDAEFQGKYDKGAQQYDAGLDWLFKSFYEDEQTVRNGMIDLLSLRPDARVLELGCGTGKDSELIAHRLGSAGHLYLSEISTGMLKICKERMRNVAPAVEFALVNASYLPFKDGYFDAVFHFGGLNAFSEKERAIEEMTRVTRVGGRVVVGDEGVPPWLKEKLFGKILVNANPLYRHEVPLDLLPECARNVSVRWILGNAFYLISYDVGEGSPPVDIDLAIPGKGDSLRSRYYGAASAR